MAAQVSIQTLLSEVDEGSSVAEQIDERLSQELIRARRPSGLRRLNRG